MSEQNDLVNNKSIKIDSIIKYNFLLIDQLTEELKKSKEDDDMDEATLLILEKQIGIVNYVKKLNDSYQKVIKRIELDAKSGKKTTLKKMKKVVKKKKYSSSSDKKHSSQEKKKVQTDKKKGQTDKKKVTIKK